MAVSTNEHVKTTMPTTAPFSYAQAAKGRSMQTSAPVSYKTSSISSTPYKQVASTNSPGHGPDLTSSWADDSADLSTIVNGDSSRSTTNGVEEDSELVSPSSRPQTAESYNLRNSDPSSPEAQSSPSFTPKENDVQVDIHSPSEAMLEDKSTETPLVESLETIEPDDRKERTFENGKGKAELLPLKEAPPPMVNFWTQRAQDAKAKQALSQPQATVARMSTGRVPSSPRNDMNGHSANNREKSQKVEDADAVRLQNFKQLSDSNDQRKLANDIAKRDLYAPNKRSETTGIRGITGSMPLAEKGGKVEKVDKVEPLRTDSVLPPVRDAVSWPSVEHAKDEERRKAQAKEDRVDKDRATTPTSKSPGHREWVHVPFTPSVKFNTPMPTTGRRGGRGGSRGGRDMGSRGGLTSASSGELGDSATPSQPIDPQSDFGQRGRGTLSTGRASSQSGKFKRPASEGKVGAREQRPSAATQLKRPSLPEGQSDGQKDDEHITMTDFVTGDGQELPLPRRKMNSKSDLKAEGNLGGNTKSTALPSERPVRRRSFIYPPGTSSQNIRPFNHMDSGSGSIHDVSHASADPEWAARRPSRTERKSEGAYRPFELSRDSPHHAHIRSEGRPERSRGGRTGRGAHHHQQTHQYGSPQSGNGPLPPIQTSGYGSKYNNFSHQHHALTAHPGSISRPYRPGPRSASIPGEAAYGRQLAEYAAGSPLATTQPYMNFYDFAGMYPVSQYPYVQYMEQVNVLNQAASQLNYYFSLENLLKDLYLRKHMDSQGFVSVSLLANFKKLKSLGADAEIIKFLCLNSPDYELRMGSDGKERVRTKVGWEQWVLGMKERDPSAQNEGPSVGEMSAQPFPYSLSSLASSHSLASPSEMSSYNVEATLPLLNGPPASFAPNPVSSPINGPVPKMSPNRHSLSALESELTHHQIDGSSDAPVNVRNGSPNGSSEEIDSFPDEKIKDLTVIVRPPNSTRPTHLSETSRTYSDGSVDAKSMSEESAKVDERSTRLVNMTNGAVDGQHGSDAKPSHHGAILSSRLSAAKSPHEDSLEIYWAQEHDAAGSQSANSYVEAYDQVHSKALQQRESAQPGRCSYDMDVLYLFWSHFLVRNFNTGMYDEFRKLAFDDVVRNVSNLGMNCLAKFYSESLASQRIIRNRVARHYVELVKAEDSTKSRPIFKQLRAAWRNGALNMKNRKKISDFVDAELRAELER